MKDPKRQRPWKALVIGEDKRESGMNLKRWVKKRIISVAKLDEYDNKLYQNINLDLTKNQKRILVCYLDFAHIEFVIDHGTKHTNYLEFIQMIKILIEMDFRIDICRFDDIESIRSSVCLQYDYILGMGAAFREAAILHNAAIKILYMTENPYEISYCKEKERIDYFFERHRVKMKFTRTGIYYKKGDEALAEVIICLGDDKFYNLENKNIYRVSPTGLRNFKFVNSKVHRFCNKFLVFGAEGFIHKGIDILIEIFNKHPDWTLHLCGSNIKADSKKCYYTLGENIIEHGFVCVDSDEFMNLAETCTFVILLSCSEAAPTGVLTCMRHGMIPIVLNDLGMEIYNKYCFVLNDFHIDYCEQEINKIMQLGECELKKMSDAIFEFANKEFSLEQYTRRMKDCMKTVLK